MITNKFNKIFNHRLNLNINIIMNLKIKININSNLRVKKINNNLNKNNYIITIIKLIIIKITHYKNNHQFKRTINHLNNNKR
jgi:hypothetical protein